VELAGKKGDLEEEEKKIPLEKKSLNGTTAQILEAHRAGRKGELLGRNSEKGLAVTLTV